MTPNSSFLWTSEEAIRATAGTADATWQATGVSIDSRAIEDGDLFVAIVGPNHDGHRYVSAALSAGAAAAVIQQSDIGLAETDRLYGRLLRVENTMTALEDLARFARARTAAKIIAITGSVGKTGSKEMLKLVLGKQGQSTATAGNLNNQWGLPLSLARMPVSTDFGIFELGMNHSGEIKPLTIMTRPDVALITTVEPAHSAFFNSIEDIADAKAEIFAGVKPSGCVVLNADNPMFSRLSEAASRAGISDIRTFGSAINADCRLVGVELEGNGSRVIAELRGQEIKFEIGVPGRHWVLNALGILCCVDALGADVEQAAAKLIDLSGLKGRGRSHRLSISGGTLVLIDESYNASPASMVAAIEVLGRSPVHDGGRRVAVLGDMLELGQNAEAAHEELVQVLSDNAIDLVFTTGQYMAALWSALPSQMRGGHAMTAQQLSPLVRSAVQPGDVVTVKGSLGSRTGLIVDDFLKLECELNNDVQRPHAVNGNQGNT